jgi:hypothetical protein
MSVGRGRAVGEREMDELPNSLLDNSAGQIRMAVEVFIDT